MDRTDHITHEHLFEAIWFAIKYVVTFENPLVSVLVAIFIGLNALHLYKIRASKKYAQKASKMSATKIFGVFPIEHPSFRDYLILCAISIGLFGLLMFIFIEV